jgi:dethiobiotin synthetase
VRRLTWFITGTDTGVGKTALACLLTRFLCDAGASVAALKPVCSGGRDDAKALFAALGGTLTLEEINPWHFRAPRAPLVAARLEKRKVQLAEVLAHARRMQKRFQFVLVEGAGGLLSPLGENFDSRGLLKALRAAPIVVCPNRLGAINQVLLVLAALPPGLAQRAQVVLMSQKRAHAASRSNLQLLSEVLGPERIQVLPWLQFPEQCDRALASRRVRKTLDALVRGQSGTSACFCLHHSFRR